MLGPLHDPLREPQVRNRLVHPDRVLGCRAGQHLEADMRRRERQFERLPHSLLVRTRGDLLRQGAPPAVVELGLHVVLDCVDAVDGLPVELVHHDVDAALGDALLVDFTVIERQRQILRVRRNPKVRPVACRIALGAFVPLHVAAAAEVFQLVRRKDDFSIPTCIDRGHQVVGALEHRVGVVARLLVRRRRRGTVRAMVSSHRLQLVPRRVVAAVHLHIEIRK